MRQLFMCSATFYSLAAVEPGELDDQHVGRHLTLEPRRSVDDQERGERDCHTAYQVQQ